MALFSILENLLNSQIIVGKYKKGCVSPLRQAHPSFNGSINIII